MRADTLEWLKGYARDQGVGAKKLGYGPADFVAAVKLGIGPEDIFSM